MSSRSGLMRFNSDVVPAFSAMKLTFDTLPMSMAVAGRQERALESTASRVVGLPGASPDRSTRGEKDKGVEQLLECGLVRKPCALYLWPQAKCEGIEGHARAPWGPSSTRISTRGIMLLAESWECVGEANTRDQIIDPGWRISMNLYQLRDLHFYIPLLTTTIPRVFVILSK